MKRRTFLHKSLHAAAGMSLFGKLAANSSHYPLNPFLPLNPENDKVLVIIFLNGGNDGLNTVIPLNQYATLNYLRPHVILPEQTILPIPNTELGLHPALTNFRSLYGEGRLKIVRGVGYPNQNFSHFRSTDIWMSGADHDEVIPSGWMGRSLNLAYPNYPTEYPTEVMPDPLSVEIGYSNSLLFQGPFANMGVVINGEDAFYELVNDVDDEVPDNLYGEKLTHVRLIRKQSQVYGAAIKEAAEKVSNQLEYPDTSLGQQLKIVSQLIAGGLKTPVYKVELRGFDTHANQVDPSDHTKGVHHNLLKELDDAVMAFLQDTQHLGIDNRIMGMTFSEFGRRIVSNASLGTDHGSAGPMFFFGNWVEGGVIGNDYELDNSLTHEDNLAFQYDFRQVYSSVLNQWLCFDTNHVNTSMINSYDTLPIVQPEACGSVVSSNSLQDAGKSWLEIFPNPVYQQGTIQFRSLGDHLHIELLDVQGKKVAQIAQGVYPKGDHQINFSFSHLPSGTYIAQILSKQFRQAKMILKK